MSRNFEMPVTSVFYMPGQGIVLAGIVRAGVVAIGDRLTVTCQRAEKTAVVVGIERLGTRELIGSASEADEVAICFRGIEANDLPDGLQRVDEYGWKAIDLTVQSPPAFPLSRWWKRIFSSGP